MVKEFKIVFWDFDGVIKDSVVIKSKGYEKLFLRQVQAIANKGDVLLGISTSGKSKNIIKAFEYGSKNDCKMISLTNNLNGTVSVVQLHL